MRNVIRRFLFYTVLLIAIPPVIARSNGATAPHFLKYSVSGKVVTVISAVTPYDSKPHAREVFLNWFKRGFEAVLVGNSALMISWDVTPEAEAGRKGYDFGTDEAERYLKKDKERNPSTQTTSIPLGN